MDLRDRISELIRQVGHVRVDAQKLLGELQGDGDQGDEEGHAHLHGCAGCRSVATVSVCAAARYAGLHVLVWLVGCMLGWDRWLLGERGRRLGHPTATVHAVRMWCVAACVVWQRSMPPDGAAPPRPARRR